MDYGYIAYSLDAHGKMKKTAVRKITHEKSKMARFNPQLKLYLFSERMFVFIT